MNHSEKADNLNVALGRLSLTAQQKILATLNDKTQQIISSKWAGNYFYRKYYRGEMVLNIKGRKLIIKMLEKHINDGTNCDTEPQD